MTSLASPGRSDGGAAASCSGREGGAGARAPSPRRAGGNGSLAGERAASDCHAASSDASAAGAVRPRRRRGGALGRAAAFGACAALAALWPCARAQTDFTDAPAGDYLTFCMEAATGFLPTGSCADASYDTLQRYFATALTDPFAESNATTLEGVTAICNAGCDSQLLTLAQRYIGAMPAAAGGAPEDNSWCATVTGNNTAPLLGNSIPFLCTQNEDASYCVVEVGKALYEANVLQQLMSVIEGGKAFNTGDVDTSELCRAMFETGCCAQTFLDVVTSMLLMTCHSDTAQQLQSLFQGCQPALKPGCQYNFVPFEMPEDCPEGGLVLPKVGTECPIPTGSCPVTQCEFLCAVVAADPPGDFTHGVSSSADADEALGDSSGDGALPGAGALASRQLSLSVAKAAAPARAARKAMDATLWLGVSAAAMLAAMAAASAGRRSGRSAAGAEIGQEMGQRFSRELSWPPVPAGRL